MNDLVVSLETAKKLKDAGFSQTTAQYWNVEPGGEGFLGGRFEPIFEKIAAPTAQEIADRLPVETTITGYDDNGRRRWEAKRRNFASQLETKAYGDTMAEALANLYLRLAKENQL